jgi:5-methylcytosine-specific restriction protein A
VTPRKPISGKNRKTFFKMRGGICYLCAGIIIPVKEAWDIEHVIPLAMGGKDDLPTNGELVHTKCHKAKTKADMANIAEAKRRETKHLGAKPSARRPIRSKGFSEPKPKKERPPPLPRRHLFGDI